MTYDHDQALAQVRERGTDAGRAAAGWLFDGNTTEATYRRFLDGINNGDPEVLDEIPYPDLSGQLADAPTDRTIAENVGLYPPPGYGHPEHSDEDNDYDWMLDELANAYCDAFVMAASRETERMCRYQLEATP